jgi:hypothetical protein
MARWLGRGVGWGVALAVLATLGGRAAAQPDPAAQAQADSAATQDDTTAAEAGGPAAEETGAADEDPRSLVAFNVRLQHVELADGNSLDFVLFRRDLAIERPNRPDVRFATLRFDLPVGRARIGAQEATGLGDLYFQALNFRDLARRFTLGSGLAFQLPTATDDLLGTGKWLVAPSLFPVRTLPAGRGLFFTRMQDFISVAGDDDRRDVHYLEVAPTLFRRLNRRTGFLIDTTALADWQRDGEVSWRSGLQFFRLLGGLRAAWIKVEVPWGEHRRGEWTLRASIAWRRPTESGF